MSASILRIYSQRTLVLAIHFAPLPHGTYLSVTVWNQHILELKSHYFLARLLHPFRASILEGILILRVLLQELHDALASFLPEAPDFEPPSEAPPLFEPNPADWEPAP